MVELFLDITKNVLVKAANDILLKCSAAFSHIKVRVVFSTPYSTEPSRSNYRQE
jgi:hypothetical protein